MADGYHIRLTRRVEKNLEEIFAYIAQDSPENAAGFIDRLLRAIDGLKQFPERQKLLHRVRHPRPVRQLPVDNYLIYFDVRKEEDTVVILAVFQAAKRPPRSFE
jgi:plasmid stabilization system protein ParE